MPIFQVSRISRSSQISAIFPTPAIPVTPVVSVISGWAARAALVCLTSVACLTGTATASVAFTAMPPPIRPEDRPDMSGAGVGDQLVVTVRQAGPGRDGTYRLSCHPATGAHPDPAGACDAVDRNTRWGRETFAPVAPGSVCTMIYGGPATAHVTGTWAGRPVDATYDRRDGCEIARWNRMVPLLPDLGTREYRGAPAHHGDHVHFMADSPVR